MAALTRVPYPLTASFHEAPCGLWSGHSDHLQETPLRRLSRPYSLWVEILLRAAVTSSTI